MSYGGYILNDQQESLITTDYSAYVETKSGTLVTGWDYLDGSVNSSRTCVDLYNLENLTGTIADNPNPCFYNSESPDYLQNNSSLLFLKLPVDAALNLTVVNFGKGGYVGPGILTQTRAAFPATLDYKVVTPQVAIPASSTGYGISFYNQEGFCTWDSNYPLLYLSGMATVGRNQYLSHAPNDLWVSTPLNMVARYLPGMGSGTTSYLEDFYIYRPNNYQVQYRGYNFRSVGNTGWTLARTITAPILLGRFT